MDCQTGRIVELDSSTLEGLRAPAEVLSLSLRGLFCLHASAVELRGGAIAFVGRSGRGKSTLASFLTRSGAASGSVADDVLPVELAAAQPGVVAGAFPAAPGLVRRLPLRAVYVLGGPTNGEISIRPLAGRESFLTLARSTVASRLFDGRLRAAHFEACARASLSLPVRVLRFPRRMALLEAVGERLEQDALLLGETCGSAAAGT